MHKILISNFWFLWFFLVVNGQTEHNVSSTKPNGFSEYYTPNMYTEGSQIDRIEKAVQEASGAAGKVVIPPYDEVTGKKVWLIDRAILLPGDMELVLDNCSIKLSDRCRDNFIRSANSGLGISEIEPLQNIKIRGVGNVLLEGADNPRSTGDHNKTLSKNPSGDFSLSYGSDAGRNDENQKGGWRNHGIILAHVDKFEISGLTLRDYHAHGIVIERSHNGKVADITFDVRQAVQVDGKEQQILNQDGLGIRFGCRNIIIDNCRGMSGDDFINIGLTDTNRGAGEENVNVVSGAIYRGAVDNIANIYLQNWQDFYSISHRAIRIMPIGKLKINNVFIENMIINKSSKQGLVVEYTDNIQGLFVRNMISHQMIYAEGITQASFRDVLRIGSGDAINVIASDSVTINHVRSIPE